MAYLNVIITDETSSERVRLDGASSSPHAAVSAVSPKTNEAKQSKASHKSIAIAAMLGQQSFSYITSNVGKWTGSQRSQTTINNITQLGSLAAMAYVSPGLALATIGMSLATTAIDTAFEQKWDARRSANERAKFGSLKGMRH